MVIIFSIQQKQQDNDESEKELKTKEQNQDFANTKEETKQENAGTTGSIGEDKKLFESYVLSELRNSGLNLDLNNLENYIMNNFSRIKDKFSSKFFKLLTGHSKEEIERNIKYNEFKNKVKQQLRKTIKELKKHENELIELEMLTYLHDLEQLHLKTLFGTKKGNQKSNLGEEVDVKKYRNEPLKMIDIRKTIKRAIKRNHAEVQKDDIIAKELAKKPEVNLYVLLDVSSSMSGKKIYIAKRAAIALAYKVIQDGNKVGLIAFNENIVEHIKPTKDFIYVAKQITKLKPKGKTNISIALRKAIDELSNKPGIKHIILISDILETVDESKVYEAASLARSLNITISIVATEINKEGKLMSNRIVELTNGKYYQFKLNQLNTIVLEDYAYYASMGL